MGEYDLRNFWIQVYHPIDLQVRTQGGKREFILNGTVVPKRIAPNWEISGTILPKRCDSSWVRGTEPVMSSDDGTGTWPDAEIQRGFYHGNNQDLLSVIESISRPNPTYLFSNRRAYPNYVADSHLVYNAVPAESLHARAIIEEHFLRPLREKGFTELDFDAVGFRVGFTGRSHRLD